MFRTYDALTLLFSFVQARQRRSRPIRNTVVTGLALPLRRLRLPCRYVSIVVHVLRSVMIVRLHYRQRSVGTLEFGTFNY